MQLLKLFEIYEPPEIYLRLLLRNCAVLGRILFKSRTLRKEQSAFMHRQLTQLPLQGFAKCRLGNRFSGS